MCAGFSPQFGDIGTWFAGLVTLGALAFAWVQLRAERKDTREAIDAAVRLAVAQEAQTRLTEQSLGAQVEANELERAAQSERARVARERHVRGVEVHWGYDPEGRDWIQVECVNRGRFTITNVCVYAVAFGVLWRPDQSAFVEPFRTLSQRIRLGRVLIDKSECHPCVTFTDADQQPWLVWADDGAIEPYSGDETQITGRWWAGA